MSEPLTAEELRRLRSDTEAGYTAKAPTVAALLATIDTLATEAERLRAVVREYEDKARIFVSHDWSSMEAKLPDVMLFGQLQEGFRNAIAKGLSALAGTGANRG